MAFIFLERSNSVVLGGSGRVDQIHSFLKKIRRSLQVSHRSHEQKAFFLVKMFMLPGIDAVCLAFPIPQATKP